MQGEVSVLGRAGVDGESEHDGHSSGSDGVGVTAARVACDLLHQRTSRREAFLVRCLGRHLRHDVLPPEAAVRVLPPQHLLQPLPPSELREPELAAREDGLEEEVLGSDVGVGPETGGVGVLSPGVLHLVEEVGAPLATPGVQAEATEATQLTDEGVQVAGAVEPFRHGGVEDLVGERVAVEANLQLPRLCGERFKYGEIQIQTLSKWYIVDPFPVNPFPVNPFPDQILGRGVGVVRKCPSRIDRERV